MRLIVIGLAVAGVLLFPVLPAFAEDGEWNTVGLRGGFGDSNNNQSFRTYLKKRISVQSKACNGKKAEHTCSMWAFFAVA